MLDDLNEECGIAAVCLLAGKRPSAKGGRVLSGDNVVQLMPSLLLDLQNRGQLSCGLSSYNTKRDQILDTYKDVGVVADVFRLSNPAKAQAILQKYAGRAAIGHTRYATCGLDDASYAQPFERHHGRQWKWFSFAFNGQLSNVQALRQQLLKRDHYHIVRKIDTEIIMHSLSYLLRGDTAPDLVEVFKTLSERFDGCYNIVFLNALGQLVVARDPLGFRPLCYAVQGNVFAAASESVALANAGFTDIKNLEPGTMIIIDHGRMRLERFAKPHKLAHCFFEWVYFSNAGSTIDSKSVYVARANLGRALAKIETEPVDPADCVVVPVPDTAKAAADALAHELGLPCVEGLLRNRYVGRTFIEGDTRQDRARRKYTPVPEVLEGKRVFLVEDSIVRATTLRVLADQLRTRGRIRQLHLRVASPPILGPCFYGIDMSTVSELFAPKCLKRVYRGVLPEEQATKMAQAVNADSLKYLPINSLPGCIGLPEEELCLACLNHHYPTSAGKCLYRRSIRRARNNDHRRAYE